jgi:hypothetical protein
MKRSILLVLPLLLLACILPAQATVTKSTPGPTAIPRGVQRVRLYPADGDLPTQLQSQVLIAASFNMTPFVEFDAPY